MNALLALPILLPLLGAALSVLAGRSRPLQRAIGLASLTAVAVLAVVLLVEVDRDGPVSSAAGGWPAPLGIALVADRFSAIMLVVAALMLLAVLVYAIGQPGAERNHVGFQSVYLILAAGVAAAFLTGDLFTLFVAIEMMLTASYVLLTLGGRLDQVRSGMTYVVISLLASVLFVTLLAVVYASTGTVNLAQLSLRIPDLPDGLRNALAVLMLVVFGIKAAIFPLFFWLPDSYPTAPSPVTAIFAGLLTKVGRVRHHPHPDAAVPGRHPPGDPAAGAGGGHDAGGRAGRHRPGRREAGPVVPDREPHRLHDHGAGPVQRGRPGRRGAVHGAPHRGQDRAVPDRRPDRARRRVEPPGAARGHGEDRARARGAVPGAGAEPWWASPRCRGSSPSSPWWTRPRPGPPTP